MTDSRSAADEADLVLLHALQIAPRAAWAQVAGGIGISAATAARRWTRLTERGDAWISAFTPPNVHSGLAFVEVDCDASAVSVVASRMADSSRVATIEETSGSRDLLLTVACASIPDLSNYLREAHQVPGVRGIRTHVATVVVAEASQWRLDALEPGQELAIRRLVQPPTGPARPPDDLDRRLAVALARDGRASATDLARDLGVGVTVARRRVAQLLNGGRLRVRCDVTRAVSGHEFAATLWLRVPPDELREAARALATMPEMRLVACVTGPHNLLVMAWLRHPEDLPAFEMTMLATSGHIDVTDRAVTLRTVKHVGRILDDDGRATAVVPLDMWAGSGLPGDGSTLNPN